ncbi:MAG: VC0807 family protein [Cyanobacteria bacterium P01_C01_bin.120]
MNRKVKIALDIIIGFIIPLLILNNLSELLGTVFAYVLAALVPVAWVLIDSFLITRRFNFITSYVGAFAISQGLLAFWFVDGVQHALKDSAGSILTILVFGISILIRRPIMHYFLMQGMNPASPRQEKSLKSLLNEPKVYRSLVKSTQIILLINLLVGITNFHLNFQIVVADFGTTAFNQQVAQVNAITRIAFTLTEFLGAGIAALLIRRAMFYYLPGELEKEQDESDFWDLLQLRDRQKIAIDS